MSLKKTGVLPFLFLVLTLALSYLVSTNQFVDYDDRQNLFLNPEILKFDLKTIWTSLHLGGYFPLAQTTFAIQNFLLGMEPWHFHIVNLLIHTTNALLVGYLVIFFFPQQKAWAWFLAILFLIHPMNVEAYAWANQRKHLLATLFYLLVLITWIIRSKNGSKSPGLLLACFALFLLGCFSKALVLTLPLALLAYDKWQARPVKESLKDLWCFFLLAGVFGYIEILAQKRPLHEGAVGSSVSVIGVFDSLVFYTSRFVVPQNLRVFYEEAQLSWAHYFVVFVLLSYLIWKMRLHPTIRKALLFWSLFFLITLAPMLKIIPFGVDSLWNERYLYLPMIGFVLVISNLVQASSLKEKKIEVISYITAAVVVVSFSVQTFAQIGVWTNSQTLWENVIKYEPHSATAHKNLGTLAISQGDFAKGVEHLEKSQSKFKNDMEVLVNLAVGYAMTQQIQKSTDIYELLISQGRYDADILSNYGNFLVQLQRYDEAEAILKRALQLPRVPPEVFINFGFIYAARGDYKKAVESFETYKRIAPGKSKSEEIDKIISSLQEKDR